MEHFANVLHDETALGDILTSRKTPALLLSLDWVYIRVLIQLESPILAKFTNRAHLGNTVLCDGSVQALVATIITFCLAESQIFCTPTSHGHQGA